MKRKPRKKQKKTKKTELETMDSNLLALQD